MSVQNRIRVGPFDEGLLVPSQAVERSIDRARALLWAKAMLDDPASAAEVRRLLQPSPSGVALDDASIIARLADLLASGSLMLVRLPRTESTWAPPRAFGRTDGTSALPRLADLRSPPESTWVELRCVGTRGESYAGSKLRLRDPEGGERTLVLDSGSTCRLDELPSSGTCWVELMPDARARGKAPISTNADNARAGRITAGGAAVGLQTGRQHILVVVRRPCAHSC